MYKEKYYVVYDLVTLPQTRDFCEHEGAREVHPTVAAIQINTGIRHICIISKSKSLLTPESVQYFALTLQSIDNVHGSNSLPTCVFGVRNRIADDILKEDFEYPRVSS
jgi:hypothetical protein